MVFHRNQDGLHAHRRLPSIDHPTAKMSAKCQKRTARYPITHSLDNRRSYQPPHHKQLLVPNSCLVAASFAPSSSSRYLAATELCVRRFPIASARDLWHCLATSVAQQTPPPLKMAEIANWQ